MKKTLIDPYFTARRSIRKFSGREVSAEQIKEIVSTAMRAPTCGNMQLYTVIATRSGERRERLNATHFNQPAATGADVILTVCADFNRFTRWCHLRNADAAYGNLLSYETAMTDALILAQQITTIAEQAGLGCCWLGTVSYNPQQTAGILQLPELVVPVAALALGWPAEEPQQCERLGVEAVLADEIYPVRTDQEILDIYKEKEEWPANAGFAAENCKENLAQVFAEVRYPRSVNEPVSAARMDFLREQGFLPAQDPGK